MGQAYGKPSAQKDVKVFTNLPKEAVQSLWTSYNLHGEGWGLEMFDFMVIFKEAAYFMSLGFTDAQLEALFAAFDTDDNGLVDALELIISLVLASGKYCGKMGGSYCHHPQVHCLMSRKWWSINGGRLMVI